MHSKSHKCSVLSVIDAHHHLDISATNRAVGAHTDDSVDTRSVETSVAARCVTPSRCPTRHTSHQLSAAAAGVVGDVMWKSSQSLQQVMLLPTAGRLHSVCRWWTRRGAAAGSQCARRRRLLVCRSSDLDNGETQLSSTRRSNRQNLLNLFCLKRLPLLS